jgi:hypothetical protein
MLPRRFRSSVAGAPCGPGRLATGSAAAGRAHGAERWRRCRGGPGLRRSCHTCATSDGERRSAAVTHGRSARVYLHRCYRSSPAGQSDRSSKLVMRVRFPSPALKPLLAASVGVGAVPDIDNEDFMLLLVDLLQHAPIPQEARAPGAIQRRVQRLPQPFRIADQRSPVMKSTAVAATSGGSLLVIARRAGGARAIS